MKIREIRINGEPPIFGFTCKVCKTYQAVYERKHSSTQS